MQLRSAISTLLVMSAVVSLSCSGNPAGPSGPGSAEALVGALRQQGATVVRMEQMSRDLHCLAVGALRLAVNGENVYVFEYETAGAATRDASTVSSDGSQISGGGRACIFHWVGPPRFYQTDRLIVLYVGTNQDLIRTLDGLLGRPFAAR